MAQTTIPNIKEELKGVPQYNWPGTWVADGRNPIVVDRDVRGGLQYVSGDDGDQLTNIYRSRIQYGMVAYVDNDYTYGGGQTRQGKTYYKYSAVANDALRSTASGELPNTEANWTVFTPGGAGGGGGGPPNQLGFISDFGNTNNAANATDTDGDQLMRDLTIFYELDGTPKVIREFKTYINKTSGKNMFAVELASFTPTITAQINTTPLNWDVPSNGFNISVINPTDYTSEFISSLYSLTATTGSFSALNTFSATGFLTGPGGSVVIPSGGVSWYQGFNTDADSYIRTNSSAGSGLGGSASANLVFNTKVGGTVSQFGTTFPMIVSWNNPGMSISTSNFSGTNFLGSYTAAQPYTVSISGMTNIGNYVSTVTGTRCTISNSSGSGNAALATAITYANYTTNIPRISAFTVFTRPVTVTGFATPDTYRIPSSGTSNVDITATWTFPSFYLWTSEMSVVPSTADVINVSKTAFNTQTSQSQPIVVLGDKQQTFSGTVNNPSTSNQAFWFGVHNSVPLPTIFTGGTSSLQNPVGGTDSTRTVDLSPAGSPANTVVYRLLGGTLNAGSTVINIS